MNATFNNKVSDGIKKNPQPSHFFQPKLTINQPNDTYEQEADAVAEKIMRMPSAETDTAFFKPKPVPVTTIQRSCAACEKEDELQRKENEEEEPIQLKPNKEFDIQRKCTHCEEEKNSIQRKQSINNNSPVVSSSVQQTLSSAGQPMDKSTRSFMEQRFGYDFGKVQIHNDSVANQSSADINALAYTHGNHIVFAAGQYQPDTSMGKQLLAHELTHNVQQTNVGTGSLESKKNTATSTASNNLVQREVNPGRVEDAETVLKKIKSLSSSYTDLGKVMGPAIANMARLAKLGIGFNPGADTSEKNNSFVYTCRCGWIDLGHFFISATGAYGVAFMRQFESLKPGDIPIWGKHITDAPREIFVHLQEYLRPVLEILLSTVGDGNQAAKILADADKRLASDEAKDTAIAFGYWMEFIQQAIKIYADSKADPDESIKGSQRSAFTIEDLPSDTYGSGFGQKVWDMVNMDMKDSSPYYEIMSNFFSTCGAVYSEPDSTTRCEMMEETTPGSCSVVNGKPKWTLPGEPRRYNLTDPYLLKSAKPLCKGEPVPQLEFPGSDTPKPGADSKATGNETEVDRSLFFRGFRLRLGDGITIDNFFMDPMEGLPTGSLELSTQKRRASLTLLDDLDIHSGVKTQGPTIASIDSKGGFSAFSTLHTPFHIGNIRLALGGRFTSLSSASVTATGRGDLFDVDASAEFHLDYEGLFKELKDLTEPEQQRFKKIIESDDFKKLIKELIVGNIGVTDFLGQAKKLLEDGFPEGFKMAGLILLDRLKTQLLSELLPIYTGLEGRGTVRLLGVPVSYFTMSKGTGRTSPLWGTEAGLLTSELFRKRAIAGGKLWVYGERIIQGHVLAGFDMVSKQGLVEIDAETQALTGMKLDLKINYQRGLDGNQQFFVSVGGEHNFFGSK